MARLARVVAAGLPHHVTRRGTGFGVAVWGYRLMPDHVHLILVPGDEAGLRAALGEAHRRYELGVPGYPRIIINTGVRNGENLDPL